MSAKGLIDSAVEHLRTSASVKTVYGEPVRVDGKTFIPVAKVAYGFGGGSAKQSRAGEEKAAPPGDVPAEGAGGGMAAKPVGVVEIGGGETKFVSFGQTKRLAWAAAIGSALGLFIGMILGRRRGTREA
jgi:uncharacterized spore protein YtfJ